LHRGNIVNPLSELQAAVLLPQFEKLDRRNEQRAEGVHRLEAALTGIRGVKPFHNSNPEDMAAYYKVGLQLDRAESAPDRVLLVKALRAEGMAFDEGFRAADIGRAPSRFRAGGPLHESEKAHHGTIVMHHPILLESASEIDLVATAVRKVWTLLER
jgi:dTDP-4-amino-4,6-dideoxygalactose transaminase